MDPMVDRLGLDTALELFGRSDAEFQQLFSGGAPGRVAAHACLGTARCAGPAMCTL
jgi:hypothetical protein